MLRSRLARSPSETRHRGIHIHLQPSHSNRIRAQKFRHKCEEDVDPSRSSPTPNRQAVHPPSPVHEAHPTQVQESAETEPVFRLLGLVVPQPGMVRTLCLLGENSNQPPRSACLDASLRMRDPIA